MREADFETFAALLAAEAEIRNAKPLSEGALLLWWQRMARFELEQVQRALDRHEAADEANRVIAEFLLRDRPAGTDA